MIPAEKREAVKKLVSYRQFLGSIKEEDVCRWVVEDATDGAAGASYPMYADSLLEVLECAYDGDLLLPDYMGIIANAAGGETELEDIVERLEKSDYRLVMAVLTCIIRQERYMAGLWAQAVRERWFYQILGRLEQLLDE